MTRWHPGLVGLIGLVLTVAACGSSDSSGSSSSPTPSESSAPSSASTTGSDGPSPATGTPATGTPVTLGMVSLENSTVSFPEASVAAKAAIDYVNDHGGLMGHPIELSVCKLLLTPESDTGCANQFASDQPIAVLAGAVDAPSLIVPTLSKAKIPWITANPADPTEYNDPYVFGVTGGAVASVAAFSLFAKDKGDDAWTNFSNEAPSFHALQDTVATPVAEKVGVKVNGVTFPPTAVDLTSYMTQASQGDAGTIAIQSATPFCISAVKAAQQLALTQQLVIGYACETNDFFKGAGSAWPSDGLIEGNVSQKPGDPDTETYQAAMDQYASGAVTNGFAPTSFAGVMDLAAAVNAAQPSEITAATVQAAMKAAKDVPAFLTLGGTFTCDGSLLPAYSSLCAADGFFYSRDSDGTISDSTKFDAADVLASLG